MAKRGAKE
ncbi:hypothetical protein VTH06DRAFT_3370 [Thermothelomyces fergusii]